MITTIKGKDKEVGYEGVIDGWYLDIADPGCAPEFLRRRHAFVHSSMPWVSIPHEPHMVPSLVKSGTVPSKLESSWYLPQGLPVDETSKHHSNMRVDGKLNEYKTVDEKKVVEFSSKPVDPALFEVPPDFKKVKEM